MSAAQDPSEVPMAQLQQPKNGPPAPSKPGNPSKNAPKGKTGAPAAADTSGESNEPSKAEAKKIAKLNKQARRAKEREEREQGLGVPAEQQQQKQKQPQQQQQQTSTGASAPAKKTGKQLEKPAVAQRRTSAAPPTAAETKKKREQLVSDNIPPMFAHLAWQSAHKASVSTAGIDIHPAVLALGLQIRDYVVCGSSARCVATLLAFKQLIISYTTPAGTSLARHLTTHLSHQINFLISCRPLSISQGNAIRGLKLLISKVQPQTPEEEAKAALCDWIDNFINEKITIADQAIANRGAQKINDGDVILCYAASNIVRRTLLTAHEQGKKFRVTVIDSRPLFEGKHFARALVEAGMDVQYTLTHGLAPATKDATKVFLGAHAMTSNGCLYSRVGTALVAMSAKDRARGINIPVIVLCETVKFTDRVALDSIVVNEIADPDELVGSEKPWKITDGDSTAEESKEKTTKGGKAKESAPPPTPKPKDPLENWKSTPNLQLLNIMHDVTPREYIDMVITEMGILPPSAVPTVHRMSTEHEEK